MKKLVASLAGVTMMLGLFAAVTSQGAGATPEPKVIVCKYVSNENAPGGEVFGQVIDVSANALDGFDPALGFPQTFTDDQGKSVAVRYSEGPEDHGNEVTDCGQPPVTTTTPPPGTPSVRSTDPTCENPSITVTGINPTDEDAVFAVYVNGQFIGNISVGGEDQGNLLLSLLKNGDVITVKFGETTILTKTINLDCPTTTTTTTPPPGVPGPTPCPGKVTLGPWYGDPRINITLTGRGTFTVKGGVQRSTGTHVFDVALACQASQRIGRYKVEAGHHLRIYQDGILVVDQVPPVTHAPAPGK